MSFASSPPGGLGARWRLCVLALCVLAGCPAAAHERFASTSHSIIIVRADRVDYYLNMSAQVAGLLDAQIAGDSADLQEYFASELSVKSWDSECRLERMQKAPAESAGNRIVHLAYHCPVEVRDLSVKSHLFLDLDETHTQMVRLASADDPRASLREAVLTASNKTFHVPDVRSGGSASGDRVLSFFKLGIEHLLTGYDHILFLLTVIVAMSLADTIKAVTAFTIAHSVTMALAFLGVVSLPASIVEPLIAMTIVYVAMENVLMPNARRRWALTGLFGLVHGLGFVGALKTITVSREELLLSLASFNIGIEVGQLLVIAMAAPALWYLRTRSWNRRFCRGFSMGVGALGSFWLIQRVVA